VQQEEQRCADGRDGSPAHAKTAASSVEGVRNSALTTEPVVVAEELPPTPCRAGARARNYDEDGGGERIEQREHVVGARSWT
jgi:hypothetical protein